MDGPVRPEHRASPSAHAAEERVPVNDKLQDAFVRAMTGGVSRDASRERAHQIADFLPWSAALPMPMFRDAAASRQPAPPQPPDHELTTLVERLCAEVYVGETSRASESRALLALQGALPGASAEIVREGAFVRVRLRAANDQSLERMQSRRHLLVDALTAPGSSSMVTVEIIRDHGSSRDSSM